MAENSVLSMFAEQKKSLEDHADDLNLRQAHIAEVKTAWNAIRSLSDTEGWGELTRLTTARVEYLRAQIVDGAVEDAEFARGELKALLWFVQAPSLAEAHLMSAEQAQEALNAEKEDFILGA